jgi:hypothetical protein
VLQQGERIALVAGVIQQPVHQPTLDIGARHRGWPFNDLAQLVPRHARHQQQILADTFRQPAELFAIGQVVGPQGD